MFDFFTCIVFLSTGTFGKGFFDDQTKNRDVPDSLKRYPFKSAIIELEYGGSCSAMQKIYIDDYGMKEAKIDSFMTDMMGMSLPTYKMQIQDWDSTFSIDMVKGIATTGLTPFTPQERRKLSEMGNAAAQNMGMQSSQDTILGKPCTVWSMDSVKSKTWLWNDITLKSAVELDDLKQFLEAKRIDLDVAVPAEAFVIPAGLQIITPDDIDKMLKKLDEQTAKPAKSGKKKKKNSG